MTFYNRIQFPVYYNDFDPASVAWLRQLIAEGHLPPGEVDGRSILEVHAEDLREFRQCHFFAGIGGWAYALLLAGVPIDWWLWTGSPPCQPFSAAGLQKGRDDERHLAPKFASLVGSGRPRLLFGEQVASSEVFGKAAKRTRNGVAEQPQWAWLDDLCDRLEAARYAVGASDFPSAGVGAPHIRQRTFFGAHRLADSEHDDRGPDFAERGPEGRAAYGGSGNTLRLADGLGEGLEGHGRYGDDRDQSGRVGADAPRSASPGGADGWVADGSSIWRIGRRAGEASDEPGEIQRPDGLRYADGNVRPGPTNGFWRDADWLFCRDGKWRPVEPRTFPLAHGVSGRVGLLRGYGNAINPEAAAIFIKAFLKARGIAFAPRNVDDPILMSLLG